MPTVTQELQRIVQPVLDSINKSFADYPESKLLAQSYQDLLFSVITLNTQDPLTKIRFMQTEVYSIFDRCNASIKTNALIFLKYLENLYLSRDV
ncbi:MAG: hypothetical protein KJ548_15005 [Actinobacteria bacterium]|nr:hypothetical protein [Actinomycetota bacterium]